jgi:L,D-peptidoglycan transpeptidase YkuD (ErfK/YbiS/YcfS/YnhG family)
VRNQNLPQKPQEKMRKRTIARVLTKSDASTTGFLTYKNLLLPVALGKGGTRAGKKEGDGATPMGAWVCAKVFYRPDKLRRPQTPLRTEPLRGNFGWCDAPGDRNYNRRVTLPYAASAESLWRDDHLYDVIVVLDYNRMPRSRGRGSAIFLHVARPSLSPTEGCIAMKREHLLRLLRVLTPGAAIAAGKTLTISAGCVAGSGRDRPRAFRGRASWRRSSPHGSAGLHGGGPLR